MIQESARTGFGVLDEEFPARLAPDLRVRAGYDLGFSCQLVGSECVGGGDAQTRAVCEAPDAQRLIALPDITRDSIESQTIPQVDMRYKS